MDQNGSSNGQRRPPHITVNSGSGGDLLRGNLWSDSSQSSIGTPGLSRQLLPTPRAPPGSPLRLPVAGSPMYSAPGIGESSEMLLPPARSRGPRPYQDLPPDSPSQASVVSSRRTSWSSDAGNRDSMHSPFASPFDDDRTPSRAGSDEDVNTQTVSEKYNIMPSEGLLLFPEDIEKDDYLHNPGPDDDERKCVDMLSKRGLTNLGGLALITLGILVLFVGYPVLTIVRNEADIPDTAACSSNPDCLSDTLPLLQNVRTSLIDPHTPSSAMTKISNDGTKMNLVFSDEFNTEGRTFYPGDDPYFQGVDLWYGVTQDLEWYDPDAITTANGTLTITFDAFQNHDLNYRSGMLQSWNMLCFKGGRLEASISLPGSGAISGFWPGFWAMGNLGRPGYAATTDGLWPYSYWDGCDAGITPNQSSTDGISYLPGLRLPACTCKNQDHPSPGLSRSAPEIDAIEATVDYLGPGAYETGTGTASQSFQAAPFDIWYEPDYNFMEIYDSSITSMNSYRGGPYQQAVSAVTWLNDDWYNGNEYQTYGFEVNPGPSGDISWFVGDNYTWKVDHRALRPNGNIGQRVIPEEPMSVIMNFGMANSFAQVFLPELSAMMPAKMRFDYIRIYQDPSNEMITCDPPGYPTTDYITAHPEPYANPNLTSWSDTGYSWPTNTLVDECS